MNQVKTNNNEKNQFLLPIKIWIAIGKSFLWVLFNSFFALIPLIALVIYKNAGGWISDVKPKLLQAEIDKLFNGGFLFFVYVAISGGVFFEAISEYKKLNGVMMLVTILIPAGAILIGIISYFNVVTKDYTETFLTSFFWNIAVIVLIVYCWFIKAKLQLILKP